MNLEFKPIDLTDQKIFQSYLSLCPQVTSDYSFVNLWSWASAYELKWAQTDEFIWVCQNRPSQQFWAPVGNWQAVDWTQYFDRFPPFKSAMVRVPEMLARIWESIFGEMVSVIPERDQFDYIYDVEDLVTLAGNRYHKKRNLLYQFQKKYDYQYVKMTSGFVDAAMAMQNSWCAWRECDSDAQLVNENMAIAKVLSQWDNLYGITGGCILVNGAMGAYTIGERINSDTLVVHFEKGSTEYKGIYQAINQMFVSHAVSDLKIGIKHVNREQDLGDAGLRRAKESYQPVGFFKKYRVDWKFC